MTVRSINVQVDLVMNVWGKTSEGPKKGKKNQAVRQEACLLDTASYFTYCLTARM